MVQEANDGKRASDMTLLEYYVGQAIVGLVSTWNLIDESAAEAIAEEAVLIAGRAIEELAFEIDRTLAPEDCAHDKIEVDAQTNRSWCGDCGATVVTLKPPQWRQLIGKGMRTAEERASEGGDGAKVR